MANSHLTPAGDLRSLAYMEARSARYAKMIERYWAERGYEVRAGTAPQFGPTGVKTGMVVVSTLVNGLPGPHRPLPERVNTHIRNELDTWGFGADRGRAPVSLDARQRERQDVEDRAA